MNDKFVKERLEKFLKEAEALACHIASNTDVVGNHGRFDVTKWYQDSKRYIYFEMRMEKDSAYNFLLFRSDKQLYSSMRLRFSRYDKDFIIPSKLHDIKEVSRTTWFYELLKTWSFIKAQIEKDIYYRQRKIEEALSCI